MQKSLVTGPAVEPVTLAELKQHLRETGDDQNYSINFYITAAREHLETVCGRAFVSQTWDVFYSAFPCGGECLQLPLGQLQSIDAFTYTDAGGSTTEWTVEGSDLQTEDGATVAHINTASHLGGMIVLPWAQVWPAATLKTVNPIAIRGTFGYGTQRLNVPSPLRQAIFLLAAHWYENREPIVTGTAQTVVTLPFAIDALIANYRIHGV
jgi:uncharacterized phiE125 gp8 family phage protein